jgi:small subunit ribosomal protein S19
MGRSVAKGPFIEDKLLAKVVAMQKLRDKKPIKTWSRRSTVTPEFVGLTMMIHTGKVFQPTFITENMVGHKLGELAPSRIFRKHGGITKMTAELT